MNLKNFRPMFDYSSFQQNNQFIDKSCHHHCLLYYDILYSIVGHDYHLYY